MATVNYLDILQNIFLGNNIFKDFLTLWNCYVKMDSVLR